MFSTRPAPPLAGPLPPGFNVEDSVEAQAVTLMMCVFDSPPNAERDGDTNIELKGSKGRQRAGVKESKGRHRAGVTVNIPSWGRAA